MICSSARLPAQRPAIWNQFTGKERDAETGLDYFMARYFSSAQGRFASPDPLLASARLTDPQTWNRYAYVRNDPVNLIDPDGRFSVSVFQGLKSMFLTGDMFNAWFHESMGNVSMSYSMMSALPSVNGSGFGLSNVELAFAEWEIRLQNTYDAIQANADFQAGRCTLEECLARNPTLDTVYTTNAPEKMLEHLGFGTVVDRKEGIDHGKFTLTGKFNDKESALAILNGPLFGQGLFSLTHLDVGGSRKDFRQRDPYGVGSLQVVINPDSGFFYADIDRFNAFDFPGGTIAHIAAEVIAPRIDRFLRKRSD